MIFGHGITQGELRALIAALQARDLREGETFKGEAAALSSVTKKFTKDWQRRVIRFSVMADQNEKKAALGDALSEATLEKPDVITERLERRIRAGISPAVQRQARQVARHGGDLRRVFRQAGGLGK